MTFRRSSAGLSAIKYFKKADYIVYVEGKSDITFWSKIFRDLRPDLKLSFDDKFGSNNIDPIIKDIENGKITGTIVCRDRDYLAMNRLHYNRNILYTYGYSFENDLINERAARHIVCQMSNRPVVPSYVERHFNAYLNRLSKAGGDVAVALDMCYFGVSSPLFLKQNLPDGLAKSDSGLLYFDRNVIRSRVKSNYQNVSRNKSVPIRGCMSQNLCGHKLFFVFVNFCKVIAKRISKKVNSVGDNAIRNSLIELFNNFAEPTVKQHYANSLQSV
jgi:hypothetical protein